MIRSSILRGSRMKVGRTTRLRSAPGRSWEMMCISTAQNQLSAAVKNGIFQEVKRSLTVALLGLYDSGVIICLVMAVRRRLAT